MLFAEAYSQPSPTSKTELYTKTVNPLKPWKIFAKNSILDFCWGSEYAPFSLKHLDKEYSTSRYMYCLLGKKKTTSRWVLFFLCFSFQIRKDLALVKFYNVTIRRFLKTFGKYVIWCKNPRVIKNLSVVAFSYLVSLNTYLCYPQANFTYFCKIFLTGKSIKLEGLLCKDKSSQKNAICDEICNEVFITLLVNLCDKKVRGCSYEGELARLGGLDHPVEISPSYRNPL